MNSYHEPYEPQQHAEKQIDAEDDGGGFPLRFVKEGLSVLTRLDEQDYPADQDDKSTDEREKLWSRVPFVGGEV